MDNGKQVIIDLNGISRGPKNYLLQCEISNNDKVFCVPFV